MTAYRITLVKSPSVTPAERQRRLRLAYDILLGGQRTADLGELGGQTQVGGGTPAPSQERNAWGSIANE